MQFRIHEYELLLHYILIQKYSVVCGCVRDFPCVNKVLSQRVPLLLEIKCMLKDVGMVVPKIKETR